MLWYLIVFDFAICRFYILIYVYYINPCVYIHTPHTHTQAHAYTSTYPTQTKVTTVLKSNLVNQLVFIDVINMSIRVTYRSRDDFICDIAISQKSPTQHDIREAATLEFYGLQQLRNWGCSGILMDQPDFIFRLKAILIQGQNKFIPIFCKICLSMTWNMTCFTPYGIWLSLTVPPPT